MQMYSQWEDDSGLSRPGHKPGLPLLRQGDAVCDPREDKTQKSNFNRKMWTLLQL